MTHTATLTPNSAGLDSVEAKENPVPSAVKNEIKKVIPHASLPAKITSASSIIRLSPPSYYQHRKNLPITLQNHSKIIFNRRLNNKKIMTICIATICEADKVDPKIVFASDRLVTDEDGYTFEIGVPKAGRLSANCYLMEAGNAFRAQRVLDSFNSRMTPEKLDSMSFMQIVDEFSKEFKKIYADTIESEIFQPRGLTRSQFYDNFAKYPDWYSLLIDQQVKNFDFGVNIILMGFDIYQEQQFGKAYIYKLTDTGEPENYSQLGFVMIGIGEKLSLPEYTQDKYSANNLLEDAMVRTYWAKRTAERMTGIGQTTDFGVIWLQKIDDKSEIKCYDTTLAEEVVKKYLDEPFEKTRAEIAKMRDGIKNQLQELLKGKQSK